MYIFRIPEMSCGHCVRAIETAMRDVDPAGRAVVDLPAKTATVISDVAPEAIAAAFAEAGYASTFERR
ncbi:heavy-metal-associated domain-containing protein [Ensifer soli]|uniref:heavy-metal-associated domain-containing protein n=1 Tax=Ciceribacter sp. sgz301302 TaxID=3342379 RepID=UPI0035B770BC